MFTCPSQRPRQKECRPPGLPSIRTGAGEETRADDQVALACDLIDTIMKFYVS
ncbi:MAG: hypothetical protein SCALA701_15830 [Candidatus Scalindua sp.]|nr:MAG: hypothetical protein SCALA701_15830 [Candidatus Scalindua sp.]